MMIRHALGGMLGLCLLLLAGCTDAPDLLSAEEKDRDVLQKQGGIEFEIEGAGVYLLAETFEITFALDAEQDDDDDGAEGTFRQALVFDGLAIDFSGRVTCLAADPVTRRAWIGGVVTRNDSEHPDFLTEIHEPGKDVWFRVLDDAPDRSTFLGFEGAAGIITSQEYCDARIWPDDNARTHPFIQGGLDLEFDDDDDDD